MAPEAEPPEPPDPLINSRIGDYLITARIGRGGMCSVYRATHVAMRDEWAIKILHAEFQAQPDVVARFIDEARAVASVKHDNMIRVVHVGESDRGTRLVYMVMDLLDGRALSAVIKEGPLSIYIVLRVLSPIAHLLELVHERGHIHRDIKPDNIFVLGWPDRPVPRLLDFGVARVSRDLASGAPTKAGSILGTPAYMAPEQWGGNVTARSDLYALGIVIYEMLTGGHSPWERPGETRRHVKQLPLPDLFARQKEPADPRRFVPSLRDEVASALLWTLAYEPNDRPTDELTLFTYLGEVTPGDQWNQDGFAIINSVAPGLLKSDSVRRTARAPMPAVMSPTFATGPDSWEGKYALDERIGAGGMAEVFRGHVLGAEGFERSVAIKRVLPQLAERPGFAEMFITEAKLAAKLDHSNVVKVTDFRRDERGSLFIVMEHIDGASLAALLDKGPLPVHVVLYILNESLRGLAHAHEFIDQVTRVRGVIHRDFTPGNVLITRDGEVKISDFGLSRTLGVQGFVQSLVMRGAPPYMSPEQVRNEPLDLRTDVFSVGVVAWEMLVGAKLFGEAPTALAVMNAVLYQEIRPPAEIVDGVPPEVSAFIMRLLERDVARRPASAAAARAELKKLGAALRTDSRDVLAQIVQERFLRPGDSAPVAAAQSRSEIITAPETPSTLRSAAGQSEPRIEVTPAAQAGSRRAFGAVLAGLSVAVVAAVGVFVVARARHHEPAVVPSDASIAVIVQHDAAVSPRVTDAAVVAVARRDAAAVDVVADAHTEPTPVLVVDAAVAGAPAVARRDAAASSPAPPSHPAPLPSAHTAATHEHTVTGAGELIIGVKPFAVFVIDGEGEPRGTPNHVTLPAGWHRVKLTNDGLGRSETVSIKIDPGKTATIERNWQK